jgi:nucleoside-diphosphate-sugar epimerase
MNQIPDILYADQDFTVWLIVGASRGIGLEFVRQLLARGERIIATVRQPQAEHASGLWGQAGSDHGKCQMYICDILSEESIVVRDLYSAQKRLCMYCEGCTDDRMFSNLYPNSRLYAISR